MLEFAIILFTLWGLSYVLGSIPSSYLLARLRHVNLLEVGTGNPGGMNAWRSVHPLIGIVGGLGDVLKGTLAVAITLTVTKLLEVEPILKDLLVGGSSVSVILGHQKSPLLKIMEGKWIGGKGFGTFGGVLLAFSWQAFVILFIILMGTLQIPRKLFHVKTNLIVNVIVGGTSIPTVWLLTEELSYIVTISVLIALLFWADRKSLMEGGKQFFQITTNNLKKNHQNETAFIYLKEKHDTNKILRKEESVHELHLTVEDLIEAIDLATKILNEWKEYINMINVFPVPDGDTGTNLKKSLKNIMSHLQRMKQSKETLVNGTRCHELRHGIVKAGRGNSGLIFTQWLEGVLAGCCFENEENGSLIILNQKTILSGLTSGYQKAYKTVKKPKEGTILTVMRKLAELDKDSERLDNLSTVKEISKIIEGKLLEGMMETIPKMEELTGARVADAGAVGFAIFMDAILTKFGSDSNILPGLSKLFDEWLQFDYFSLRMIPQILEKNEFYCIQFTVESAHIDINQLEKKLELVGDSLQISSNPPYHRIHLHSHDPNVVLSLVFEGDHEIMDIHIDNIMEQIKEQLDLRRRKQAR